jgi:hypothetical protein
MKIRAGNRNFPTKGCPGSYRLRKISPFRLYVRAADDAGEASNVRDAQEDKCSSAVRAMTSDPTARVFFGIY